MEVRKSFNAYDSIEWSLNYSCNENMADYNNNKISPFITMTS